jgi:hypothetical protein
MVGLSEIYIELSYAGDQLKPRPLDRPSTTHSIQSNQPNLQFLVLVRCICTMQPTPHEEHHSSTPTMTIVIIRGSDTFHLQQQGILHRSRAS